MQQEDQKELPNQLETDEDESTSVRPADALVGALFADKYRIDSVLGEGGMSVVYLVTHEALQKQMALKTLHTHLVSRRDSLLRFKQEAKAASSLSHSGIVAMHDYGITGDGIPYLVMDYVDGESMSALVQRVGRLMPAHAVQIFVQAANAIEHAHKNKVVHRDIKPSNIMIKHTDEGEVLVKIVDFGVAKLMSDNDASKLTQTGEAVGSPLYMSPEQCMSQPLDARSDIYSFGCVMYEALTGQPAFAAESVFAIMYRQMNDMPPAFESVDPKLKMSQLEKIVFKAMAKEPDKRYQSMADLERDLEHLLERSNRGLITRAKDRLELTALRVGPLSVIDKRFGIASAICALLLVGLVWMLFSAVSVSIPSASSLDNVLLWGPYPDRLRPTSDDEMRVRMKEAWLGGKLNKTDKALQEAQNQSLAVKLKRAEDANSIGLIFRRSGDYQAAAAQFDLAIKLTESCGVDKKMCVEHSQADNILQIADLGLGDSLYARGLYDDAKSPYQAKVTLERSIKDNVVRKFAFNEKEYLEALVKLADCYYMTHDYNVSLLWMDKVWKERETIEKARPSVSVALLYSKLADTLAHAGKPLFAMSNYEQAIKDWDALGEQANESGALDIARCDLVAHGGLAQAYAATGREEKAETLYKDILNKIEVKVPHQDAAIANILGRYANLLFQRHRWIEAYHVAKLAKQYLAD